MLEMSRYFSIASANSPVVRLHKYLVGAEIEHRFDGQDHSRNQPRAAMARGEVRDFRRLVHLGAAAVSDVLPDHAEAVALGDGLDGGRDVLDVVARLGGLYALHEALLCLQQEGLENAWSRHRSNHEALKAGLGELGIEFVVEEKARLPQLNSIHIPGELDDKAVRARLLQQHGIEIGAGLGALAGKIWRIGLMGYSSRVENVIACLDALESVLRDEGRSIPRGTAVAAAYRSYATQAAAQ